MTRILVSGATKTLRRLSTRCGDNLGVLITPQNWNRMCQIPLPWACDNSAFSKPDDRKFWNMVIDAWGMSTFCPPLWIAAPDIVGDAAQTRWLFDQWTRCWEYELGFVPVELAYVLQNGQQIGDVPWDQIVAVFVGGDDQFKLCDSVPLIQHAKRLGKLIHMGRVNSQKRLRFAVAMGADTVDGTSFSRFPDRWIEWGVKCLRTAEKTRALF